MKKAAVSKHQPWKVLIVDDEEIIHEITKMSLKDFVYLGRCLEFISAFTETEAKEKIQNNCDIAIVLLDIIMEEDDTGLELIKFIRDTAKNYHSRIILRTSGHPDQTIEEKIVNDYDIHDYKIKSELTPKKLYTTIVTALRSYNEIKRAYTACQLLEEERNIFINGPVTVFKWANKEGWPVDYVSPNIKGLLGYEISDFIENKVSYSDLILPEDRLYVFNEIDQLRSKKQNNLEQGYRIIRKDGRVIWLQVFLSVVLDSRDNVSHFIGYVLEATHQKEQELLLFDRDLEGIIITDMQQNVIKINTTLATIANITTQDAIGSSIYDFVDPDFVNIYKKRVSRSFESNQTQRFEVNINQQNGEQIPCLITLSPIKDLSDQFTGSFAFVIDLTERKKIEEALRKALETEKRFIASVSHEIRTPLSSIMGYTELLNDTTDLSTTQKKYCRNISTNSQHLLSFINDILDISKIESGQLTLNITEIEISELLSECAMMISSRIKENVEFVVDVPEFDHYFICDPVRIKQIFINLLGNAAKFTEKGSIRFYLKGHDVINKDQIRLKVCVQDTGVGISEEKQKELYQPFKQVHSGEYGGTGLGLYVSRSIAQLMEGDIFLESSENQGSTFLTELVISKGKAKDETYNFSGKNILILEKEPILSDLQTIKLSKSGANITRIDYLDNIPKVYKHLFQLKNINIAIIDIEELKNKSVFFAASLREVYNDIVLIGINSDINPASDDCLDIVLNKPFSYHQLGRHINRLIDQKENENYDFSHLKVLLVEDIKANRVLMQQMFIKFFNIDLKIANNGEAAIVMELNNEYDVIFMDVQMPVIDGIEATRAIRKQNFEIPIIGMSGNVFASDIEQTKRVGMDDFLAKPIQKDDIKRVLVKINENLNFEKLHISEGNSNINNGEIQDNGGPSGDLTSFDDKTLQLLKSKDKPGTLVHQMYKSVIGLSDDTAILDEVLGIAIQEIRSLLACIKENKEQQSADELLSNIHKLKGVLSNIGLVDEGEKTFKIEVHLRENAKLEDAQSELTNMFDIFKDFSD